MNPAAMGLVIVIFSAVFAVSAWRRITLLAVGEPTWESRLTEVPKRLGLVWVFAFYQKKMRNYRAAGFGHQLIWVRLHHGGENRRKNWGSMEFRA